MREVVLGIRLPIQCSALDVDVLILRVKVNIANRRLVPRQFVRDADFLKERWRNEVDILTGIRERSHHRQRNERSHRSTIVISWNARDGVIELGWNIKVSALRRFGRTASIVVLENWQESLLVTNVQQVWELVEIVQALCEC